MTRSIALIGLALFASCTAAGPNTTATPVKLVSAKLVLPDETAAFPATPAGERVGNACTACHSAEMILTQPRLDAAKWQATIAKMRTVYHAQIDPADDKALVAALLALQAKR